jgi:predicted PurR-regulated permease PerM
MLDVVKKNPWVRAGVALLGLVLVGVLIRLLDFVLVPLFFAFILAYIFDPLVDFFEARRISRMTTIAVILMVVLLLVLSLPLLVLPSIVVEANALVASAKQGLQTNWFLEQLPFELLATQWGWDGAGGALYARSFLAERVGDYIGSNALDFLQSNRASVAGAGQAAGTSVLRVFSSLGNALLGLVLFFGNLVFFAFMVVYLLKDYDAIVAGARDLIPPRYREDAGRIVGKIDAQLRAFFRGQMTVCCCLGAMYSVGFLLSGVPFAIPIGLAGILVSFVPYIGPVAVTVPALLFTALEGGDWPSFLGIFLTLGIAQALEGNVLTPKIVGSQVGLNPLWVILAIMVFGTALGFVGLVVAVPLAAVLKVLVVEAVARYKQSSIFTGSSSSSSSSSSPPDPESS